MSGDASAQRAGDDPALRGELRVAPFEGGALTRHVATAYDELRETYGYELVDILVVKRFPTGIEALSQALVEELALPSRPNVKTIARHASTVLTERAPETRVLSEVERIETLAMVLEGHAWEHDYFASAADHESFGRDVGRILLAGTYSGQFDRPDVDAGPHGELLAELQTVRDDFHDWLETQGWVERPDVLRRATAALADDAVRSTIEREFEAIVAVGFEEFGALERRYLAALAENATLVAVGEEDASIARVWNEPGSVADLGGSRPVERVDRLRDRETTTDRVARFLATGDESLLSGCDDPIYRIAEPTFHEQLSTIANEIGYLRAEYGWDYDDIAVLVKDSNGPIRRIRRVLRRAGIPTASATANGLGGDRAVRELHALATYHATTDREERDRARKLVADRLGRWPQDAVDAVSSASSAADKLGRWILETDLKRRIAESEPIEARAQFHHVSRVLEIAEFVERADFVPNGWDGFLRVLERAITYVASDTYSTSVDVEENGVVVDAVRICKHERRTAVFLVDVHEGQYPESPRLTRLFPQEWVRAMPGYPGVTTPADADVRSTFETSPETIHEPFEAYYAELARRQLAIGARAAADRLYFCTAGKDDSALGRRQHPSRYLDTLEEHAGVETIEIGSEDAPRDVYSHGEASATVLSEPWDQLERIQQAASTGSAYDLRRAERTLGAIQTLLESDDLDPRFEQAVYAQIDRALGDVGAGRPANETNADRPVDGTEVDSSGE
ncbi:hypothetical protein [Halosolutus gelatinilyticus]|uniref:hypothetical protein n=1 Tax=Halosolutus gelatinilyticus TaxID=2931975 RepID=UPI001FF46959|nr:hypothetical protein [Halosolutus gelatinilyticus]